MKKTKTKKPDFPGPFETDWDDTGSRVIDSGQKFCIEVGDSGFTVTRELGPISVEDLFGELSYWPEEEVWAGSAATLGDLLKQLAEAADLHERQLKAAILAELGDIALYLDDEKEAVEKNVGLGELWEKWTNLQGSHQIPGIPSPDYGPDLCYDGLELDFDKTGWTAELYSDVNDTPEILERTDVPVSDCMDYDEMFGTLEEYGIGCTRDELARLMIEDDERWRPFIESGETAWQEAEDGR